MKFTRTMYVSHRLIRYTGNLHEYLRRNSDTFLVFSFATPHTGGPCVFDRFERGERVGGRTYDWYRGGSTVLKYLFDFLYFLHAMLFLVPARTLIITMHPLFCVGNSFFSRWKRCRYVLWVHDFFPVQTGLYRYYNRLTDFYACRLGTVFFISPAIRDEYARRAAPRPGTHRAVMEHAIAATRSARASEPGCIGFIGNIKPNQGLELAIDALTIEPWLRLEVVGDGVALAAMTGYATAAGVIDRVRFWGAVTDDAELARIDGRWCAALAPYVDGNYVAYADPGKVKLYWQHGIPVIMTRCTHLFPLVEKECAGELIAYDPRELVAAVRRIVAAPERYAPGIARIASRYAFERYFDEKLSVMRIESLTAS